MKSVLLLSVLFSSTVFAGNYYCTKWTRIEGTSCVFAGGSAENWGRQCENPCGWRNYGPHCDLEQICLNQDPNELTSKCSEWAEEYGTSCQNPNTGRFEQKWVRACQTGLATTWCSDENPNRQ